MRALIAGGAGFIGSNVCDALLADEHEVVCLDNFLTGNARNIAHLRDHPRFTLVEADVVTAPQIEADLVLHLASPASPIHYRAYPLETMMANSAGTLRLLAIAAASNARFVFASTSEVYGDPLEHPQTESYWGHVNPNGPRACYDESKRFGEALTLEYRQRYGVNATILRFFNTYGPRMSPQDGRAIPAFVDAALDGRSLPIQGNGMQTRSFCYISDLVRGLLTVAQDATADGGVFNIGNPRESTVLELAEAVSRAVGIEPQFEFLPAAPDDPARRCPDIGRMRQRYGWKPQVRLEDGLDRTVAYFRSLRPATGAEREAHR